MTNMWVCAVALLLGGCGGQSVQGEAKQLGSAGGSVTTSDGTGATFPAGALAASTNITIAEGPAVALSGVTGVGKSYVFGPEGMQFAEPVTVTLAVDPGKLPAGKTLSDVVIFTAPVGSTDFVQLATTAADATHVSAQVSHFCILEPAVLQAAGACVLTHFASAATMSGSCGGPCTYGAESVCDGHDYALTCPASGGACSCTTDGVQTATATVSGSGADVLDAAYTNQCRYPGTSACTFSCTSYGSTCGCEGTCNDVSNTLGCSGGSCTCGGSGSSGGGSGTVTAADLMASSVPGAGGPSATPSFQLSCSSDLSQLEAAWSGQCGYSGTVGAPTGTQTVASGGSVDGGTLSGGGSSDAGVVASFDLGFAAPPDLAFKQPDFSVPRDFSTHGPDLAP